jgi:MFS family permease
MSALCLPALFAALPMQVDGRHLQSANSLVQIAMQGSQFVGPALAGLIIEAMGIERSYGVLALVFGLSALLIGIAPGRVAGPSREANRGTARGGLGECVALFRRERRLLGLALLTMLANVGLAGPLQLALPALAHGSLRTGADGLGLLLTTFGAGTLTGSLVAGGLSQRTNRMRIALATGAVSGVSWAVLAASNSLAFTVVILVITGACLGVLSVLFITEVQSLTPGHLRGRVMSIQLVASTGLQPLAFLLASWCIDRAGLAPVFLTGGTLVAVTCGLALMLYWKLRT